MVRVLVLAVAIVTALTACSSGGNPVSVHDAWGRTSPAAATNGAFYMVVEGGTNGDVLVGAESEVCGEAQIHETQMTDGVMSMQHLPEGLEIPAGGTVALEPGSYHVMCMNLQQELVAGESVDLTLDFANAGEMLVTAEIRDP